MPKTHENHDSITKKIDDHEDRIRNLEFNQIKISEKIECLIVKINSLMTWIKALVMLGLTSLASFVLWYLQNLIKK
ncbi:hypothetical protein [Paramaledivibacter caminithermalis]|jgi:hypothetical protein|uniref:Haemolysin XhlA n=1 Tax=Paramaledivibacter caminithermalis (strain DSM 15212 / CIP 107654 / DViRD3) TaxID=1121301 RepID=A0A1M6JVK2_PARC5|nr:hypothetical protein [Paramaledivibacter caminithermalis]SHJ50690.1 hypothetical protein SAMN02745912_00176 [Paramaledivibacter caminithermalis DSM 15212]